MHFHLEFTFPNKIEEDIIKIAEKYKEKLNNKDLYGKGSFVIRCTVGAWRFHSAEHDWEGPDYSKVLVETHLVIWLIYGEDKLPSIHRYRKPK